MDKLKEFFNNPATARQRQYEAVRAFVVENMPIDKIAVKFGYKYSTVISIIRDVKSGKLNLFSTITRGPKGRRTKKDVQDKVITYRKKNLSSPDICHQLKEEGISISTRTIERILNDAGYKKLKRRTNAELGITGKNKIIPARSGNIDFDKLKPFNVDCPAVGVFFFLPYIIETGILDIVKRSTLPKSNDIGAIQASLSMLVLKLMGNERLSNMDRYDQECGLGIFAGLNVLPKSSYMTSYSCLTSEAMLLKFQKEIIGQLSKNYPQFYSGDIINLDFHCIPHFGDQSQMQKVWCGTRGKTLKGANTIFAQDSKSNFILYTRADILRKEESEEIKRFISYWKEINNKIDETLVFDCKFTKYSSLDELDNDSVKFITLRKRSENLIKNALNIPKEKWKKLHLQIPKRKHKNVSVYEREVLLSRCKNKFREIIVKDHGRINPTFIITNNRELSLKVILEVYAKRWHIENKLAELVCFFNLNALSSPLMIRIHFDILWTIIADTLYHIFANDLRRFEKSLAPTIFKKFINMPGRIVYDGNRFYVKIRKRSFTPILKGVTKLSKPIKIPWLNNMTIEIVWTP